MKQLESRFTFTEGATIDKDAYKIIHIFKDQWPTEINTRYKKEIQSRIFTAESGSRFLDHTHKTILIGLGEKEKASLRKIAATYMKLGDDLAKWNHISLDIHLDKEMTKIFSAKTLVYQITNSLAIGSYQLNVLNTKKKEKTDIIKVNFTIEDKTFFKDGKEGLQKALRVYPNINGSRYIAHLPANYFNPDAFEKWAREIAKTYKLKITVFDENRLKKEKMGGILSVGQGSDSKARMILLEYMPAGAKKHKLAIVGKGLTFDSGGISIKPASDMHEMKYDMCGAATAVHSIASIAALGLKIPVIAAIGVVENMPDAKATRPGDVYTAYNGLTVEVQNTDAEGRLVLGDVLSYISKKYKPEYMVDLATLTGAVIVALGHEAAAVVSNSDELGEKIKQASLSSDDRIWLMPNWEEYGEDLKSDIADIRNITNGRAAGTLSAAQFLSRFVDEGIQWAHLDIAGTAWRSKASGTQSNGPTGFGVRLLVDLAEKIIHS